MDNQKLMDHAYNIILTKMVETGQAPHYTEIASALGVSMEFLKILAEMGETRPFWSPPNL